MKLPVQDLVDAALGHVIKIRPPLVISDGNVERVLQVTAELAGNSATTTPRCC